MTPVLVTGEALAQLRALLSAEDEDACVRLRTYTLGSG